MGSPLSTETRMLLRLLADGQWHQRDHTLSVLADKIAPGKALRRYRVRAEQRERVHGPRTTPELSMEEQIASGRRTLANVAMNSLKHRYIEAGKDDVRGSMLRIRPGVVLPDLGPAMPGLTDPAPPDTDQDALDFDIEPDDEPDDEDPEPEPAEQPVQQPCAHPACPLCGLYVANKEQHEEFHAVGGAPPTAVELLESVVPELAALVRSAAADAVTQVVESKLDAFQQGMTEFLDRWFAELSANQAKLVADVRRPRPTPPPTGIKYTTQTNYGKGQRQDPRPNRDRP